MRYYKYDGSFETKSDCNFGWWLSDICVDDNESNVRQRNLSLRNFHNFDESVCLSCELNETKVVSAEIYKPLVSVYVPVGTEKQQITLEGCVENDDSKHITLLDNGVIQNLEIENVNYTREKLSNLISSTTLHGKMLMHLIDFPRYKTLMSNFPPTEISVQHIEELSGSSKIFCFDEIDKFSKCESINSNCIEKFKPLRVLQENIRNLQLKMQAMKREVICIRSDFQQEEKKIVRLIGQSKKLLLDLQESTCINDILHLLTGKLKNVKSITWPFKIGTKISNKDGNLII